MPFRFCQRDKHYSILYFIFTDSPLEFNLVNMVMIAIILLLIMPSIVFLIKYKECICKYIL